MAFEATLAEEPPRIVPDTVEEVKDQGLQSQAQPIAIVDPFEDEVDGEE